MRGSEFDRLSHGVCSRHEAHHTPRLRLAPPCSAARSRVAVAELEVVRRLRTSSKELSPVTYPETNAAAYSSGYWPLDVWPSAGEFDALALAEWRTGFDSLEWSGFGHAATLAAMARRSPVGAALWQESATSGSGGYQSLVIRASAGKIGASSLAEWRMGCEDLELSGFGHAATLAAMPRLSPVGASLSRSSAQRRSTSPAISCTRYSTPVVFSGVSVRSCVCEGVSPNHALQRTATLAFSYRGAAVTSPGSDTAWAPAMKPSTCRAFASRRFAHTRASGSRSLSLGSLGVTTRTQQ